MIRRHTGKSFSVSFMVAAILTLILPQLVQADAGIQLIPGTAVLYTNTSGGGNGGNTSSASNATNIFAPASYVDYHFVGGEPTTVVDRYPFGSSFQCQVATGVTDSETGCNQELAKCSSAQLAANSCYLDPVYVSNPLGLGEYSEFYRSYDGGQTFLVPPHNPYFYMQPTATGVGGGDSHQAVGRTTHSIFFADLSGACVTMNISRDLGETWSQNNLGCENNPGVIDDRQWVATDETVGSPACTAASTPGRPCGGNVYLTFNNDTGCLLTPAPGCSIVLVKSVDDGGANMAPDWAASTCSAFVPQTTSLTAPATDTTPTACPDPQDQNFWIAGPIIADTSASSPYDHSLYIPFERLYGSDFQLWVAISRPTPGGAASTAGDTWIRQKVADLGPHDPANIFPEMTVDTAGNLYFTWSQAQSYNPNNPADEGETDAYYTYSQDGGTSWVAPIDLTKEVGDSAVFPWMVAGSPGQVDMVMYKANSGLNPNITDYDSRGQSCTPPGSSTSPCSPNTTVWNTYFGQSQNALNTGANFKIVQISDHPIHIGGVCTQGTACGTGQYQNRDLLDFLTIDYDHTGAAYTTWADDNNSQQETRQFFSRQLAGASILAGHNIAAMNSYPITDHSVTDPAGDVVDASGLPDSTCPSGSGMDILGTSESQTNGVVTITLTLDGPPNHTSAIACAREAGTATGGLWGAEFWASSAPSTTGAPANGEFYVAYRDDILDAAPDVEAGQVSAVSPALNHFEFDPQEFGTLGGTCFPSTGPPPTGTCTIVLTVPLAGLSIKPGAGLYSISGFSVYYAGSKTATLPGTNLAAGNSNLADIATPFDDNGTGRTK